MPPSDRQKRNIRINGKRTTMVLEPYVWQSVDALLQREDVVLNEFCQLVDRARMNSSLASSTRLVVLTYFRLLDNLNNPPFWDPEDAAVMPSPAQFAAPASARQKLSVLPLAIRRFAQQEARG